MTDRLQEAKEQLCAVRGHSQSWVVAMDEASREPIEIACGDCGKTYEVAPFGKPRPFNREYAVEARIGESLRSILDMARRGGVPARVLADHEARTANGRVRYVWRWVGERRGT